MSRVPAVLSVAHHYPPHIGGLENVAQQQARGLAAAGCASAVVTTAPRGVAAGEVHEDGVRVRRCAALNVLDERFGVPFPLPSPALWPVLCREVRRADVVHVHDVFYLTSWIACLCAFLQRRPLVLTQHVALVEHPSALIRAVQRVVYATAGRLIFAQAARIVVYNRNVRQFLTGQGVPAERVQELSNGIDTARFTPLTAPQRSEIRARYGLPQDRLLALFVGRLVPKKGVDHVIGARSDHYDLVLVGPGQVPDGARQDGIHVLGPRSQAELADLYGACDMFVFPAVGEILTLVMQEAMAAGLPVVTTDDPAYAAYDLDPHLLRLVPPSAPALQGALEDLATRPDLRARMAAYSRDLAERRFDWNANFTRLLGLYRPLLERA